MVIYHEHWTLSNVFYEPACLRSLFTVFPQSLKNLHEMNRDPTAIKWAANSAHRK